MKGQVSSCDTVHLSKCHNVPEVVVTDGGTLSGGTMLGPVEDHAGVSGDRVRDELQVHSSATVIRRAGMWLVLR